MEERPLLVYNLTHGHATVCKTCSDYKHVCLGYTDSTAHLRSQSDSASRTQAPPLAGSKEASQRVARAVESCSPEPPLASAPRVKPDKSPQAPKQLEKDASSRETSLRTNKESDLLGMGGSPESGEFGRLCCSGWHGNVDRHRFRTGRTSVSSSNRTHVPYFRYFGPTAIVPGFKQMVRTRWIYS
jgi:hypothetical protein